MGSTNDLKRRFLSHENGYMRSTRSFRPVSLLSYVAVETEIVIRSPDAIFQVWLWRGFRQPGPVSWAPVPPGSAVRSSVQAPHECRAPPW
ncbi:MAG TPA: excinuclease ABC subunit C [Sinorhizobium sp.]|nr:excinuclease ABC subunit C [Sinorhizobium sp.]